MFADFHRCKSWKAGDRTAEARDHRALAGDRKSCRRPLRHQGDHEERPLVRLTSGVGNLSCSAANLGELFSVLDEKFPDLKPHLRDEAGEIRRFLNVYVNEEDIRFLGGPGYAFQDGDEILLVPSIAGGS